MKHIMLSRADVNWLLTKESTLIKKSFLPNAPTLTMLLEKGDIEKLKMSLDAPCKETFLFSSSDNFFLFPSSIEAKAIEVSAVEMDTPSTFNLEISRI